MQLERKAFKVFKATPEPLALSALLVQPAHKATLAQLAQLVQLVLLEQLAQPAQLVQLAQQARKVKASRFLVLTPLMQSSSLRTQPATPATRTLSLEISMFGTL